MGDGRPSEIVHLVRFRHGVGGVPRYGRLLGGFSDPEAVQPLDGDIFGVPREIGAPLAFGELEILAPCEPTKVIGVASNYRDHAREMGRALPAVPKVFLKPPTAVGGPGGTVYIPPGTTRVDHEAEVAVVIGERAHRVSKEDAMNVVFGLTAANDVTCRDFQASDGVFTRGKGFDGFAPLGPTLAVGLQDRLLSEGLAVRGRVDGELRQDGHTRDMVFDVPTLIEFVSSIMTLLPGDVILTGTPAGVGPLTDGQRVEVEVEGVGVLVSHFRDRDDR